MPLSAEQRAARVKALVFDVDGVLTRGEIIYGSEGEWKVFSARDGMGFDLARQGELKIAIFSGRSSEAVRRRATELQVTELVEGVREKGPAMLDLIAKLGVKAEEVGYVGDDLVDLPAMAQAGFPVAVAGAADDVKNAAAWVTTREGGDGAAREVIEFVLKARGLWPAILHRYQKVEHD